MPITGPPIPPTAASSGALPTAAARRAAEFLRRFSKVDPSPDSLRGLTEIFRRASAGGKAYTSRPKHYLPVHTRSAAPELKTLVALSRDPDVQRIEVVPSQAGPGAHRTPDFIVHRRENGKVVPTRVEVTTVTGAGRGYRPTAFNQLAPAAITPAAAIEAAVRRKAVPSRGQSQLAVPFAGVAPGGTLVVHVPRGGAAARGHVDAAMQGMAAQLRAAPHVHAVQFVLPGSTVRYIRAANGAYDKAP
jgi:hypothetical protein